MLMNARFKVARNPGIQNSVALVGQDIDAVDLIHATPLSLGGAQRKKCPVIARSAATKQSRSAVRLAAPDCFAALAMTAPLVSSRTGRPPGRWTTRDDDYPVIAG